MHDDLEQLIETLLAVGWKLLEPETHAGDTALDAILEREDAVLGIVLKGNPSVIESSWVDHQEKLMAYRQDSGPGRLKDFYLLFVVEQIKDSERSVMRRITGDTHYCRKLLIERKGRPMAEALQDVPYLSIVPSDPVAEDGFGETTIALGPKGINRRLMEDLAKRSAETVLQRLIDGSYDAVEEQT